MIQGPAGGPGDSGRVCSRHSAAENGPVTVTVAATAHGHGVHRAAAAAAAAE